MIEWKPIINYINLYEISNTGEIWSIKSQKILKPQDKDGYLRIELSKDGKRSKFYVHRLVAETFIPMIEEKDFVNHIDGNRTNNNYKNLEWVTMQENISHSVKMGTHHKPSYNKQKPVIQFDIITKEIIYEYPSLREAERQLGINVTEISKACRGKVKTAGGYEWQYA